MFNFCSLYSGSTGNCLFVQSKEAKILVDAGVSQKKIETALASFNITFEDIDAILVTHEHVDHIKNVGSISKKYNIPVYCNIETLNAMPTQKEKILDENQMIFTPYETTNEFNGKNYEMVLKVGIEKSGYYYIFEKSKNRYKVYRSNIQNGINKTYLFETDSKELLYIKDSVFYIDGKYLKCYNNENGNQIILENKELEFNHNIKIGLYH